MKKKKDVYMTHVMFPWETFPAQADREKREKENEGARWTDNFLKEIRENILRYDSMEQTYFGKKTIRNSLLSDVYKMCPIHFRGKLFEGIVFNKLTWKLVNYWTLKI